MMPVAIAALFRTYGLTREQSRLVWSVLRTALPPDSWDQALDSVENAIEIAKGKPDWEPKGLS